MKCVKCKESQGKNHKKMLKYGTFVKKRLKINMLKIKKYHKARDHCNYAGGYRGASHRICNLKYSIPKEITVIFDNGFNCD